MPLRFPALLALLLSGCGRAGDVPNASANAATEAVARDARPNAGQALAHLARIKAAVRAHLIIDYGAKCLPLDIPEAAFIPIHIDHDGLPDVAVALGRASCPSMGATGFSSTGGSAVQFWRAGLDEPPRLLGEAQMLGFTARDGTIRTLQHGSACGVPGAAGCVVTYRWNDGTLVAERKPGAGTSEADFEHRGFERTPNGSAAGRSRAEQLARMRSVIRQDALMSYAERCGAIALPDKAFHEIEITGDDFPELAVSIGRAHCPAGGANSFEGTGGPLIQIWHMARDYSGTDGPVRLVLESNMHGFTPRAGGLVTLQHGGRCPGGAGPDMCRVVYRWEAKGRHLDVIEQRFQPPEGPADMQYGRAQLSWVPPD